jgi:hypothetical protein
LGGKHYQRQTREGDFAANEVHSLKIFERGEELSGKPASLFIFTLIPYYSRGSDLA